MRNVFLLVTACALLSACSSDDPVSIGDDDKVQETGFALRDYAGNWDGYTEGSSFGSGSDRVRLTLDVDGEGYLEVGELPLVPAATDPDLPPPRPAGAGELRSALYSVEEGFRYTVRGTKLTADRIQLGVDWRERYTSWCELQTPFPFLDGKYSCFYNTGYMREGSTCTYGDEQLPVDCSKLELCNLSGPCDCTSESCTVDVSANVRLDAALEAGGDKLVGTFLGATVRLHRQ